MGYKIETVPMPRATWSRLTNPLLKTIRDMDVGQSLWVSSKDENYRDSIVGNMNQTDKPKHFFKVPERNGVRIFRDR